MTLMDPAQLAAQQVQRPQAVDDLEHEAEHQPGRGKAEAEEQADAGLLQGLGQGAAVLGHHQGEDPIRTGQQHGTGHDEQGSLLGPLPTKRSGSPKADFRPWALRWASHRERERLTTVSPSSSCQ
jgi:hypothetical protein